MGGVATGVPANSVTSARPVQHLLERGALPVQQLSARQHMFHGCCPSHPAVHTQLAYMPRLGGPIAGGQKAAMAAWSWSAYPAVSVRHRSKGGNIGSWGWGF